MTSKKINEIFDIFSKNNPNPQGELYYINDLTCLIAIMLSAQMTDVGVNKVTKNLFQKYNTVDDFVSLDENYFTEQLQSLNYYRTKAKNILKTVKIIKNNGMPKTFEKLIKLPGVGRKTANVYLNAVLDKKTIGVDTHVSRVSQRLGLTFEKNPEKIEIDLIKKIPDRFLKHAHQWLVLHGRYVCKAKKPKCNTCIFRDKCLKIGVLLDF